ncbi:MAG: hypothetical protein L0Y43_08315, partial [Methylococcaceae bacterium]|nr:hypothetical protein [Methylococcaceae bacterium]
KRKDLIQIGNKIENNPAPFSNRPITGTFRSPLTATVPGLQPNFIFHARLIPPARSSSGAGGNGPDPDPWRRRVNMRKRSSSPFLDSKRALYYRKSGGDFEC